MVHAVPRATAEEIVKSIADIIGHEIIYAREGVIYAATEASRIGDYHELAKDAENSPDPLTVRADSSHPSFRDGIVFRIEYKDSCIGAIGITGPITACQRFVTTARKVATLILREQDINTQSRNERSQMNFVMHTLITRSGGNREYMLNFLASRHLKNYKKYRIIIVQMDTRMNPGNLTMLEKEVFSAFDRTGSDLYAFNYPNEYVLMLEDKVCRNCAGLLEELASENPELLKIGIGEALHVERMNESYDSARTAVLSLKNQQKNIAWYDRLGALGLIASLPDSTKAQYSRTLIGNLTDKETGILGAYFQNNNSLKKTAQQLFIHRNTLQYQLDKIHQKTGLDPRNFQDSVTLYLALQMKRL